MKGLAPSNSTILVTGGLGYIGSWVCHILLENGYTVRALDSLRFGSEALLSLVGHPRFQFIEGDIRDKSDVRKALEGVSGVAHLAAIVGEAACDKDPTEASSINLDGTRLLADSSISAGVERFIFFSTCSSYGVQDTGRLADENTPLNPVSLYARTKIEAETWLRATHGDSMCCTVFRPSTVHGPSSRMRFDLIVNHFVRDAFRDGTLKIFGPDMWRPLMWVGDAGRAIAAVLNAEEKTVSGEVFNLGDNNGNYQKREIGTILKDQFLPDLDVQIVETDLDQRSYKVDFSKIETQLGFSLAVPLDAAIQSLLTLLRSGAVADTTNAIYRNA